MESAAQAVEAVNFLSIFKSPFVVNVEYQKTGQIRRLHWEQTLKQAKHVLIIKEQLQCKCLPSFCWRERHSWMYFLTIPLSVSKQIGLASIYRNVSI